MLNRFLNKSVTPTPATTNETRGGWSKTPPTTTPARVTPATVETRFDLDAALKPERVLANIAQRRETVLAHWRKQLDQLLAAVDLTKDDLRRRQLQVRVAAGDPASDSEVRDLQARLADLETKVAGTNSTIAYQEARFADMAARGPDALATYVKHARATVTAMKAAKAEYDRCTQSADVVERLLMDQTPNGASCFVGLRTPNGSILNVQQTLRNMFGFDSPTSGSWFTRFLREAADRGIDV